MAIRFNWNPFAAKKAMVEMGQHVAREAAQFMAARAVLYAPVDTGHLAYNIHVQELGSGLGFRVVSTAFYSPYVEFGHLSTGGTWVAPNPFLRRALADTVDEWPQLAGQQRLDSASGSTHNPEGFLGTTFTT